MAANIFQAGGSGNWGSTASWSLGAIPTASDGNVATFNATSPACIINTSARVCNGIDFTGYTNTITFTFGLTVSGNTTLSSTMSFAGAGSFAVNASGTLTSNGKVMPQPFLLQGTSQTYVLADNWTISGLFTCNGATTTTINGAFTITAQGGYTQNTVTTVNGSASLKMTGGTWTSITSNNVLRLNTEIAGNVTFNTNVAYNTGTLTWTSGTPVVTGNIFTCSLATTFNTNGMSFNIVNFNGAVTYTLTSDMDVNGTMTIGTGGSTQTINGAQLKVGGTLNLGSMTTGIVAGTTTLLLDGTGTIIPPTSTGSIRLATIINTTGTITFGTTNSATIRFVTGGLTYTSGTIISTGSTLTLNILTVTLNALLQVESLNLQTTVVFAGTSGFTCTNLVLSLAGTTHTFVISNTYTITGSFTSTVATLASPILLNSTSAGTQANIILSPGATQDIGFTNATDINSSGGQPIRSYKAVLSNATNWSTLPTQLLTLSYSS